MKVRLSKEEQIRKGRERSKDWMRESFSADGEKTGKREIIGCPVGKAV